MLDASLHERRLSNLRELLTLSWSARIKRYGDVQSNQPCRFLHELPQADLHWQGKDPEADQEVTRETAQSHMQKIAAMLAANH